MLNEMMAMNRATLDMNRQKCMKSHVSSLGRIVFPRAASQNCEDSEYSTPVPPSASLRNDCTCEIEEIGIFFLHGRDAIASADIFALSY